MELLPEIWQILVPYFSLEDLTVFRVVSRYLCEYTKSYEGNEFAVPYSLKHCFRCFPKIKMLNTDKCFVGCEDFLSFANVEELSIETSYLVRDTNFAQCVQLKKLYLSSDYFYQNRNLDNMFKYLPQLVHLSLSNVRRVTDTAFDFTNKLEVLDLSGQCSITSQGILKLKHLKKLSIDSYNHGQSSLIRDHAFEGSPIEDLFLYNHDFISDQGMCMLKQLRKVVCVKVQNVQGVGWNELKKLETVGIGCITVNDVSNFKMAKTLSFQEARIGKWSGIWPKMEKLRLNDCTIECADSMKTIQCPRLNKIRIIRCPRMNEHEDMLCNTFGTKLVFRV